MNPNLQTITQQIIDRSVITRTLYLEQMQYAQEHHVLKKNLSCTNMAHACAALDSTDKTTYTHTNNKNIAIVTAYNDMLSAHQPFENFPNLIKNHARTLGLTTQVAGGVPAMCDGITQGYAGMELSLFSRDQIAQSAAIALSHACFDGVVYLGVCDKIIPGLLIAAMRFGYLPTVFCPAGPMPSGISNSEKARVRTLHAQGKATNDDLLSSELKAYHSAGTCTFYGTANSNQLLMEIAGLHLPHTTFIPPNTPERETATKETITRLSHLISEETPLYKIVDERTIVNMIVALNASGGSTNLTIHLIAIAAAAGIIITWDDISAISNITPLICKLYPNGSADVNQFHQAGGIGYIIHTLSKAGLLHNTPTVTHHLLYDYGTNINHDTNIIRSSDTPFSYTGGLVTVKGEIGQAIVKVSALASEKLIITAPAKLFYSQQDLILAFQRNELNTNFIAVLPYQGPKACGMPELHKLIPTLSVLQNRGFTVGLLTDGRMSGASGTVPCAIHVSPEAASGGLIGKITDNDMITLDCVSGIMRIESQFNNTHIPSRIHQGFGRELFCLQRDHISSADTGATIFKF